MDRVRFGRALGVGAREAAKALVKAADAATAPNPAAAQTAARPAPQARVMVARKVVEARETTAGIKRGSKRFGSAVWAPVAKASGVVFLEVIGVLFGLFAAVFGLWVWKMRADLWGAGVARERAWFAVGMMGVFLYLTVSSYVRAARRGRR